MVMRAWHVTINDPYEPSSTIVRAETRGKALNMAADALGCDWQELLETGYSDKRIPALDGGHPGQVADWEKLPYLGWIECDNCYVKIHADGAPDGLQAQRFYRYPAEDEEDEENDVWLTPVRDCWFVFCSINCWRSWYDPGTVTARAQFSACPEC